MLPDQHLDWMLYWTNSDTWGAVRNCLWFSHWANCKWFVGTGRPGKKRSGWFADHHGHNDCCVCYLEKGKTRIELVSGQGSLTNILQGHRFGTGYPCYTLRGMGVVNDGAVLSNPAANPLERDANPSLYWQDFILHCINTEVHNQTSKQDTACPTFHPGWKQQCSDSSTAQSPGCWRSESATKLAERIAWQQIKHWLLIYCPHHLGTSLLAFPTLIIFTAWSQEVLTAWTTTRQACCFLPSCWQLDFSHSITIFTCESDDCSCDPRVLVLLASLQTFGHSNFKGIICKAEETSTVPLMLSPGLSFPWGQLFYLRAPWREISNSTTLFFWPLISDTYSCLITSCSNSQKQNEIAPGFRCQFLAKAKAGCTLLFASSLFYSLLQPVSLQVCPSEIQTSSYFTREFTGSDLV